MEVVNLSPDLVFPYPGNPRRNEAAVGKVAASILEFGFRQPIVVDEKMVVIVGHTRLLAAKKLGLKEVPVHVAKGLTAAQVRTYRIADNRTNEEAEWDDEKLRAELEGLRLEGVDLGLTGFDSNEIAQALAGEAGQTDPDEVPEPEAIAATQMGDVWLLGNHRLVCGDSTDKAAVEACVGQEGADLVFTDPPYNVAYSGRGQNKLGTIKNDDMDADAFNAFLDAVFDCCSAAMKPLACIYVCHPDSQSAPKMAFERAFAERFKKSSTIIWVKQSAGMGWQDYRAQHEPILYGWKEAKGKHFYCGDRSETTVWQISRDGQAGYVHPTQKPVALPARAIKNSSKPGQIVLDMFGGSGSTMMACEVTGRHSRCLEMDPKFVDVAIRRWQNFTGKSATLQATGQTFEDVALSRIQLQAAE